MVERDIRGSTADADVRRLYQSWFRPGSGHVWTAQDVQASSDGAHVYMIGQSFLSDLDSGPSTSGWRLEVETKEMREIAPGARLFQASPLGEQAACIRGGEDGSDVLQIRRLSSCDVLRELGVGGRVEALSWSPDGQRLLLLVAGTEADISGAEGGYALGKPSDGPSWLPEAASSSSGDVWRRLLIMEPAAGALVPLTTPPVNVWEACWLGDDRLLAICSDHHSEGSWYGATLRVVDRQTGGELGRYEGRDQLGLPAGSPDGRHHAIVEAVCSDRGIICGSVSLFRDAAVLPDTLDLAGVEVSDLVWRDDNRLLYAGLRGAETVVGEYELSSARTCEIWASEEITIGGWYPRAAPIGDADALAVVEAYERQPAVAFLSNGSATILQDFAPGNASVPGRMEHLRWRGRDGLEISGWLLLPDGETSNLPLLVDVHGGPIAAHRNRYAATFRADPILVQRGWAVLLPNPRGSGGRGQDFARRVVGDMGGEDAHDILAGIDELVAQGVVDACRIAIFGSSYGGYMGATMIARHRRFATAVSMSSVSNWYSQHFASQIPWFDEAFLDGSPRRAGGAYFKRSPVFFLSGAKTPTLVIGGGRDKNTPTSQAVELYNGLIEAGAPAGLLIYPEDGHSMRGYPAYIDSAARIVDWLEKHVR